MLEEIYQAFLSCNQNITTDTRKISEGCIFFALKGPNFNGNKFASDAIKKGAAYVVIDEENIELKNKSFLVQDVLTTLQKLSNYHRKQFNIPVIGITGTNGKTTTKELIGEVLKAKYNTLITEGNLNNHIGVPLTLLKLNSEHEMAVIEMGASKRGDIKELVEIADPDYGIITNIGKAHLEGFGSTETIKKTKMEMYDYILNKDGKIIYNLDDSILTEAINQPENHFGYGHSNGHVSGKVIDFHPTIELEINYRDRKQNLKTALLGDFNLYNILCAATVGYIFRIESELINKSLESYTPSNHRSQLIKTKTNTIIADCYNANPTSTLAALKSLSSMNAENKIAILGDMLELGENEYKEHEDIVQFMKENNINGLLVGSIFSNIKCNFPTFEKVEFILTYLENMSYINSTILIKGSRGIKLEKIIEHQIL